MVAAPTPGGEGESRPIIVCVDDEPLNLELFQRALGRRYQVLTAGNGAEALALVREHPAAVVVTDLRMPGLDGAGLLGLVAELRPTTRRVVVTGYPEADHLAGALAAGKLHYILTKPWRSQDLVPLIDQLVDGHRLELANQQLAAELRSARERGVAPPASAGESADGGASFRDPLTGLYTHRAFQERLQEEVARAVRHSQPLALLFADVDGFAAINHELGFQVGDEALRRIGRILSDLDSPGRVRSSDIVGRYSGEEFVVLLPETTKSGALTKAIRLRDAVEQAEMPGGKRLTISVGVAALPDDATSPDGLISCAESALKGAKRSGSGRVHFFDTYDAQPGRSDNRQPQSIQPVAMPQVELDRFRPYHERIPEVVAILQRDRSISCLLVDLTRLRRLEHELGLSHHAEVYDRAGAVLDELRGSLLRAGDLVCRTTEGDSFLVVLAPRDGANRDDLKRLGRAVEEAVESALASAVRDLLKDQPRIVVGTARVLGNTMIRPERLIARLVSEAVESARLARERASQRDKALLQDIILGDGLSTVFQPIVHLETGDTFGFEALTRGPRQTAMESPATLFSVADEVDLTFELDRACFRGALRSAIGVEPVHRLCVNLLPRSFYDSAFIEIEVGHLLEAAALTPANIVFEITERLAIENFTTFRRALAAYAAMGFGVAIDDVGTRHSNLETVMALRPDFIKLSDVLTRGVARSTVKREMLRSLGRIGEAIDAVIVAEGIETPDDLLCLRDLGVRYGQGFFIARPGAPFPTVRASVLQTIRIGAASVAPPSSAEFEEDGDLREAPPAERPFPIGSSEVALPGHDLADADDNEFAEEVETADSALAYGRRHPRGSAPPGQSQPIPRTNTGQWTPLRLDDEPAGPGGAAPAPSEVPLIDSLIELRAEPTSEKEPAAPGERRRDGLN